MRKLLILCVFLAGCVEVRKPVKNDPPKEAEEKRKADDGEEVARIRISIPYFYIRSVDPEE